MSKTIIIGAGGQIGHDLVPALHRRGDELFLVDRVTAEESQNRTTFEACLGGPEALAARWRIVDVTVKEWVAAVIREIRPDEVYHLAALLSARCEEDPDACWRINMASFENVVDALYQVAGGDYRPKLIWPSSIAAFGPPYEHEGSFDANNEHPLLPRTVYGVTKVACELLGAYYAERRGIDFRSVRFPGLLNTAAPGGGSSDYANAMYFGAANGTGTAESFVSPEGRMAFMHMRDAVGALLQLAAADESKLTRRTYNVNAFPAPSAEEIAASIAKEVPGFTVTYHPDYRQANVDSWPDGFDDTLARRDWGWQPEIDSLDALTRQLLADFREEREEQEERS